LDLRGAGAGLICTAVSIGEVCGAEVDDDEDDDRDMMMIG
jgi:hypothetical protein